MSTSLFPDVNVWFALSHQRHSHYPAALCWSQTLSSHTPILFCRHTQLGLLRMLTLRPAMADDVQTQQTAWATYDVFFRDARVQFVQEPPELEKHLRRLTSQSESSPKLWADAYLAAFAEQGKHTLVTFDVALAGRVKGSILLS